MKPINTKHHHSSRRDFLKKTALATLGSSSLFSLVSQFNFAHAQTSGVNDYKALVCVFLYGGNDAYSMLVPHSQSEYNSYADTRRNLAIPRSQIIPIAPINSQPADYGLHPELVNIADLFSNQKLSFVNNIGTLIEPTSQLDYVNKRVALPPQLFSHNDQQNFVMSLQATKPQQGWASRMAEMMMDVNGSTDLAMNISLSGANTLQMGGAHAPYTLSAGGVSEYWSIRPQSTEGWDINRVAAYRKILDQNQSHLFAQAFADTQNRSLLLGQQVSSALDSVSPLSTQFDLSSRLSASLRMIANLIAARSTLNMNRQIFFVGIGDYDTHGDQANRYPVLMRELNHSLNAFYNATVELGVAEKVTTFTASDFGRTLTSNGDGTDHGWGSHQMIMGGAIDGGKFFGSMPELTIGSHDDIGEGRIIPTTSVDQYAASLANWYGLPQSNISQTFPNLANFNNLTLPLFS
jgi:uncharacterized protein (DUF1501 family)